MNKALWLSKQLIDRSFTMPVLSFPAVQKLNCTVSQLIQSASLQAEAMRVIASEFPTSAAVSLMDLSVEAECFGAEIRMFDMEVATVTKRIVESEEEAKALKVPAFGTKRDLVYRDAILEAKKLITDRPVFAGVIGPYSLAGRLMDMTEIMILCYEDPDMVHTVLKKTSEFILSYIKELKKAGADGVVMAEPAAGLLSPDLCKEFSSDYIKAIVKETKADDFVFIYHNCGNVVPLANSIIELDADIYHFGNAIDIEAMLQKIPSEKIVMGNIDPAKILKNGNPESIKKAVLALLERCNRYPNFVISSGCDIPPMTSWDNLKAYFDAIQTFFHIEKL